MNEWLFATSFPDIPNDGTFTAVRIRFSDLPLLLRGYADNECLASTIIYTYVKYPSISLYVRFYQPL